MFDFADKSCENKSNVIGLKLSGFIQTVNRSLRVGKVQIINFIFIGRKQGYLYDVMGLKS